MLQVEDIAIAVDVMGSRDREGASVVEGRLAQLSGIRLSLQIPLLCRCLHRGLAAELPGATNHLDGELIPHTPTNSG